MRVEQSLLFQRPTDLLWRARVDGQWDVYEPGDEALLPPPPLPGPPQRLISVQEFRSRFTPVERRATIASPDLDVQELVFLLSTRTEPVDLDDPQIVGGVDLLIARGITTLERKVIILA